MKSKHGYLIYGILVLAIIGIIFISGCTSQQQNSPQTNYQKTADTGIGSAANEIKTFGAGIFYREPVSQGPEAQLIGFSSTKAPADIRLPPGGFDIKEDMLVYVDDNRVIMVNPQGEKKTIEAKGIHMMARPSISTDAKKVVVQAADSADSNQQPDLNIYLVGLDDGTTERIGTLNYNEESPEWFAVGNKIAYTSFSPSEGINIHIYDTEEKTETHLFEGIGSIHLAISKDGKMILNPLRMQIYDSSTGLVMEDFRAKLKASIKELGYNLDTRFPGQANLGTFPLDGDFSPDARKVIMDGAVEKDGKYYVILFTADLNGGNISVIDTLEITPAYSNNNSYSQLNPLWR